MEIGEYDHATGENAIKTVRESIEKYGKQRELMTDHGTQFTSLPRAGKESEPNEFQKYLKEQEIVHIKARVKHPQTNGKLKRLNYTLIELRKYFSTWEEVIDYYNNRRNHMSLCGKEDVVTPAMAYGSKKAKEEELME